MFGVGLPHCATWVVLVLSLLAAPAYAFQIQPGVGVGVEVTDNAAQDNVNEIDETITTAYVGLNASINSGSLVFSADTSLSARQYRDNTFEDDEYFRLNTSADWSVFNRSLVWRMRDYFTQQRLDTLDTATPDNLQDTNVFTFGPDLTLPVSKRQTLNIFPQYRRFYYEISNADNEQAALSFNWIYHMLPTVNLALVANVTDVDYRAMGLPGYTASNYGIELSGKRSRSEYSLNLGITDIDREIGVDQDGTSGRFDWLFNISSRSTLELHISSEITDSSINLLDFSVNPISGDINNQQIVIDVYRDKIMRLEYEKTFSRFSPQLWLELRDINYTGVTADREIKSFGGLVLYRHTARLSSSLSFSRSDTALGDNTRDDDDMSISASLSYNLSRKLNAVLRIRMSERDSTLNTVDYEELRGTLNLVYGYSSLPR